MLEAIEEFRNEYAARYSRGAEEFLGAYGASLIEWVESALTRSRSTIYLFGNGGSYAISKCLKYAIEEYAAKRKRAVRVETGVDVNRITDFENKKAVGVSFVETLKQEGADSRDLVILISGSGNSDNLCRVARFTRKSSVPTLALIGSSKGKLRRFVASQNCFITPLDDQQISEDIIQSLAYSFELDLHRQAASGRTQEISSLCRLLRKTIQDFPARLLEGLADKIIESFEKRTPLWVLGVGHAALNVCAEHTAHNLYWDGIFEVARPPQRLICSSSTGANLSGISNDRRTKVLSHLMGFREAEQGCAIIYGASVNESLKKLVDELAASRISSFLLYTNGAVIDKNSEQITAHKTNLSAKQVQAGIAQIFGHILGRIVRMKLLESERGTAFREENVADFLVTYDLAQRRLLHE